MHLQPRSVRRVFRSSARHLVMTLAVAALAASGGVSCRRQDTAECVLWTTGDAGSPLTGLFSAGGLAAQGKTVWAAYVEEVQAGSPLIRILRLPASPRGGSASAQRLAPLASFAGQSPALGLAADGGLLLLCLEKNVAGENAMIMRRGSPDGRRWSEAIPVSTRRGEHALANGRLVQTAAGTWIVPAVWRAAADSGAASEIVCYASRDDGKTWEEGGSLQAPAATDPAVAEIDGAKLLMVLRQGTELARSVSADGGRSWTRPEPLGIETWGAPPALLRLGGRGQMALAWTDPAPDTTVAPPGVQALRLALSSDAGRTWRHVWPLALRAGRVPASPALAGADPRLVAFFEDRHGDTRSLACVSYDLRRLEPEVRLPPPESARGRYALDDEAARDALRLLSEHTLARPSPSMRLFIEGYYRRALVAAHEVLGPLARERGDCLDTRLGLLQAIAFADWMAGEGQNERGYWPLGYKALYVADMAAAAGLFAALDPHVDEARRKRYEQAGARFVASLERDAMILPSGACGVGWPESRSSGLEARADRDPYLVSTALAGIEVHAWLYRRSGRAEYRQRALAALDYTLSQLRPDGSLEIGASGEGVFAIAAYVEEGWMSADLLLGDDEVRARLRRVLPAHVDWLLRSQRPDGTWNSGADGEFARTPAILDFLIWYDQRCNGSEAVRRAVRRASAIFLDPVRWQAYGLYRTGKHEDVLRAIAGRPLAALAGERFVP